MLLVAKSQLVPFGSNNISANPFAALDTMNPLRPVVRSLTVTFSPCAVSSSFTISSSPEFMNRVCTLVETNGPSGLGEPGGKGMPSIWMYAKLTYSTAPPHAALFPWPVFIFSERLSIFSAAHQRVLSQLSNHPGG